MGRKATDGERQKLYRVRDTLGIKSTDALWALLLVLEYYLALYEKLPQKVPLAGAPLPAEKVPRPLGRAPSAEAALEKLPWGGAPSTDNGEVSGQ